MTFGELDLGYETLYALVDPFFGEPPAFDCSSDQQASFAALSECRTRAWGRPVWVASGDRPLIEPFRLPFIVQLEVGDPLLDDLQQLAINEHAAQLDGVPSAAYRLGSFIQSDMPPELIMQRLEGMWSYSHRSLARRYLRLGDRRVMELLFHVVRPQVVTNWLGPLGGWCILGRSFGWHWVKGAMSDTELSENDSYRRQSVLDEAAGREMNLRLNDAEHGLLLQSEAISLALTRLQQEGVAPDAAIYSRLPDALSKAGTYRFRSPQDSAVFIANTLGASRRVSNECLQKALALYPNSTESLEILLERTVDEMAPHVSMSNVRT